MDDAHSAAAVEDHRRRGRRRGHALEAAILAATIAEIEESGYADLSMERVAARARASKASLYRRWPTKVELVMSAAYILLPDLEATTDTGSLRGDLLALHRESAQFLDGPAGRAIRGLVSDALRDPALAARFRSYARGSTMQAMRLIVQRAHERSELDAAAITTRQLEAGPTLLRMHFLTHEGAVPDDVIVEIVDEVVMPLLLARGPVDGAGGRGRSDHLARRAGQRAQQPRLGG
jgi:AcrR family transcriptional regulator